MKTLKQIYDSHEEGFKRIYEELENLGIYKETSWPLLLADWTDNDKPKAMFFGKETNGWVDKESIEDLMAAYDNFNLGCNPDCPDNTLFWQYARIMSEKLGLEGEHPFYWNNINKLGLQYDKGRPNPRATQLENKYFNVLIEELGAINPTVCVFFTGPSYDDDIRAKLPDVEFIPVEGYALNELACLRSKYLPEKSYRTYHPGYGNRYRDWYLGVLDTIAKK